MDVKGILFDLDGVVLKSMEQHLEAWQYAFRKYQVHIVAEDFYQLEGRGVRSVVEDLTTKYNLDPKLKPLLVEEKIRHYQKIFNPLFYDGLFPLLDDLKAKNIKMAIVTGGDRDRVHALISKYFDGYFAALVTSDDVSNTKPFPEPYLKGAEALGLRPEQCLVVENAPLGIKSARSAGIYVIGVQTTVNAQILSEANIVVKDMQAVRKIIMEFVGQKS